MGQQQLLLIVLGVIIVAIAVVVGITVFSGQNVNSNRDAVTSDLTTIANLAQTYYRKPASLAGGGSTFTGFTIPTSMASNANGTYTATVAAQTVTLVGKGKYTVTSGGTDTVQVSMTVTQDNLTTMIVK